MYCCFTYFLEQQAAKNYLHWSTINEGVRKSIDVFFSEHNICLITASDKESKIIFIFIIITAYCVLHFVILCMLTEM